MSTCTPQLRHVLYMAGTCALSVVVLVCIGLADHRVEPERQDLPSTKTITVRAAAPTDSSTSESGRRPEGMGAAQWGRASGADLPDGPPVPAVGRGTWHVVPLARQRPGADGSYTYSVEVEDGVLPAGADTEFGRFVEEVLDDPRSWAGGGDVALRRVEHGEPDLRIKLAAQNTARERCGFDLPFDTSCRIDAEVYLSAARWIRGAAAFDGRLEEYRKYMVNHEVGHFLGRGHEPCEVDGGAAAVMMQQTFSTANDELADITANNPQQVTVPRDGKVCEPNPWPYPHAKR
jgi:hypothetical protein